MPLRKFTSQGKTKTNTKWKKFGSFWLSVWTFSDLRSDKIRRNRRITVSKVEYLRWTFSFILVKSVLRKPTELGNNTHISATKAQKILLSFCARVWQTKISSQVFVSFFSADASCCSLCSRFDFFCVCWSNWFVSSLECSREWVIEYADSSKLVLANGIPWDELWYWLLLVKWVFMCDSW